MKYELDDGIFPRFFDVPRINSKELLDKLIFSRSRVRAYEADFLNDLVERVENQKNAPSEFLESMEYVYGPRMNIRGSSEAVLEPLRAINEMVDLVCERGKNLACWHGYEKPCNAYGREELDKIFECEDSLRERRKLYAARVLILREFYPGKSGFDAVKNYWKSLGLSRDSKILKEVKNDE